MSQYRKKIVHTLPLMKNTVVACGGGAVLLEENWDAMKKAGPVICLTARDEIIYFLEQKSDQLDEDF